MSYPRTMPREAAATVYERLNGLRARGLLEEAIDHLRAAKERVPHEPMVYKALIPALRSLRRHVDAEREARSWLTATPFDAAASATVAHVLMDQERYEEAAAHACRAGELAP